MEISGAATHYYPCSYKGIQRSVILKPSYKGIQRSVILKPTLLAPASIRDNFQEISVATARNKLSAENENKGLLLVEMDTSTKGIEDLKLSYLTAISPVDGRYGEKTKVLRNFFSEYALMRYRVMVEVKWLLKLSQIPEIPEVPEFSDEAISFLEDLHESFCVNDALEIKDIEKVTNHDVKAVEYFLKRRCSSCQEIEKVLEFIHFGCTSEDINNLCYALMLRHAIDLVILPRMDGLLTALDDMTRKYSDIPMLSKTHGEPDSPTTLGEECHLLHTRLVGERSIVDEVDFLGKFAGAVGNYNAHYVAYPKIDWPRVMEEFVESLGIKFNPHVTQIEPHDYMGELFDAIKGFNNILLEFNKDVLGYISLDCFKLSTKAGEIGSSTMPHKVNPIYFKFSEGNLGLANALFDHLSLNLPISRFQRDLSDSTVLRNLGIGFAYSILFYESCLQRIHKLQANESQLATDMGHTWEVLAEPIQTEMHASTKGIEDLEFSSLTAITPIDGRYGEKLKVLRNFFSEYALMRYRVLIEVTLLLKLSQIPEIPEVPEFSDEAISFLEKLPESFDMNDATEIGDIEKVTNDDVKAVEYFLKRRCKSCQEIEKVLEFIHFACTSRDINNLCHALMLRVALDSVILPIMDGLVLAFDDMARKYSDIPMLSRTHGQPASPTTLGKEFRNFHSRLVIQRRKLPQVDIFGKFACAVGNHNAHYVAYPKADWPRVMEEVVESLGIKFNPYVTKIPPRDYIVKMLNAIKRFNTVLLDFDKDVWGYISFEYFKLSTKAGEIGSSTMPHKVNPIDFENSEGNLGLANVYLTYLSGQRHSSDSTVLSNLGIGLACSALSYESCLQGIHKLQAHESRLATDLDQTWEVLAEPIQMVMRQYGVPKPYENVKDLTRGREVTKESIQAFVQGLDLPDDVKTQLLELKPANYIGAAKDLAGWSE